MGAPNKGLFATGTIQPCRFISVNNAADSAVTASASGDLPIGVSAEYAHDAPFGSTNNTYAAASGQNVAFYGIGEICLLELTGTVAAGDYLKVDSAGTAITGTIQTDKIGAQALEAGVTGSFIRVYVMRNA